jgi:hypothetical protein
MGSTMAAPGPRLFCWALKTAEKQEKSLYFLQFIGF